MYSWQHCGTGTLSYRQPRHLVIMDQWNGQQRAFAIKMFYINNDSLEGVQEFPFFLCHPVHMLQTTDMGVWFSCQLFLLIRLKLNLWSLLNKLWRLPDIIQYGIQYKLSNNLWRNKSLSTRALKRTATTEKSKATTAIPLHQNWWLPSIPLNIITTGCCSMCKKKLHLQKTLNYLREDYRQCGSAAKFISLFFLLI